MKTKKRTRGPAKPRQTPRGKQFAALVLKWRNAQQLSQPKAAERLGVPYRTFQDWEYGQREPRGLARVLITRRLSIEPISPPGTNNKPTTTATT